MPLDVVVEHVIESAFLSSMLFFFYSVRYIIGH